MNKLEAQQLIDKHIADAEASLAEAGKVAEEHKIAIHSGKFMPKMYGSGYQYYPKGLPRGDYPWFWADEDEYSEKKLDEIAHEYAGRWTASDVNCS